MIRTMKPTEGTGIRQNPTVIENSIPSKSPDSGGAGRSYPGESIGATEFSRGRE